MKMIIAITVLSLSALAYASSAMLVDQYVSGANRICVYEYLGSQYVRTIRALDNCPSSIQV